MIRTRWKLAFKKFSQQIACVIVEPVVGNMGCVPPSPMYLDALREITDRDKSVLIFDEVMTGFRLAFGGAQERYGILPDLTTFGKIIGGGLPVGAYGGPSEIMDMVAPLGPVYQAGTLSGNPLAMAAGLATLRYLRSHKSTLYTGLELTSCAVDRRRYRSRQRGGGADLAAIASGRCLPGSFSDGPVTDWTSAAKCDTKAFARFFRAMLDRGVYLPPSQFEAAFLSAAHTEKDVHHTIAAARQAFATMPDRPTEIRELRADNLLFASSAGIVTNSYPSALYREINRSVAVTVNERSAPNSRCPPSCSRITSPPRTWLVTLRSMCSAEVAFQS